MPERPQPLAFEQRGLTPPVGVDPTGLNGPTRGEAAGPRWRRSSRGLYVPAGVDDTLPEQRIVEAAAVLPSFGGLTGWAALRWSGGVWFDGRASGGRTISPVTLATGYADVRNQPGITVSQERLDPSELLEHDQLPLTTLVRSVCFEARYAPTIREAVVGIEMAAFSDLVSLGELAGYAAGHPGWTGVPQAREALVLASENSWSPWETRMRLVWVIDAGLGFPLCNPPLFDHRGQHIGTPDIFDPVAGVVGEYDGSLHLQGRQRSRDLAREDRFRRHGLEYFVVLAGDMADRDLVIRRMRDARRRALWLPASRRQWTLSTPAWWQPTETVDQRRSLMGEQRERLLGRRRRTA